MFKACFVVKVDPSRAGSEVYCRYRNRELDTTTALPSAQHLGSFCFPLGPENVKAQEYAAPEEYSFTLTGGDGSHLHGFCRSFLPPRVKRTDGRRNANLRLPQVLCIISPFPWFPFYYKVLQIVEALLKQGDLLTSCGKEELPETSPAAAFINNVLQECKGKPELGRIMRVAMPSASPILNISPQRRIQGLEERLQQPLQSNERFIELQIPPDMGNGSWNAGVPLARLFWHLPSGSLMALLQAILLERRILMVAQERDTLSAAVHAVSALLYPFRWQHIYLPLLPHCLKDYLTAPIPYLIGVPAPQMLVGLRNDGLEDVVYVDLDAGSCTLGGPGGPPLDFALLPWGQQLQAAFQIVYQMLRSPTEFESTPVIGHCLQEYFLKLLGSYREYVEIDQNDVEPPTAREPPLPTPGTRQQVLDDGYLRAHGFRFDHLSFVANQRRSEKARNFLDMLRHSQMYEVFINERLALAAGGFKSSDAFEMKVSFLQGKRGKVLGRIVAQAGAKGVHNISAVLQRTSTFVKAQIRHHSSVDGDSGGQQWRTSETIVPSYSIDVDSPRIAAREEGSANLQRPVPSKGEDPSSFFNHDPDAEDDTPPEAAPSRTVSPEKRIQKVSSTTFPGSPSFQSAQAAATLSSPRSTGILRGAEGFDALLNLDGVEGVFSGHASDSGTAPNFRTSVSSLLDEDGPSGQSNATDAFDLSSWGLGLPSVSEAASSVAEWASNLQALAMSFNSSEATEAQDAEPSPSVPGGATARQPSYDLKNTASLGTIDAFQEFHSPEAMRASHSTRTTERPAPLTVPEPVYESSSTRSPNNSACAPTPATPRLSLNKPPDARRAPVIQDRHTARSGAAPSAEVSAAGGGLRWRAGSSNLDERAPANPFSTLDPIARPSGHTPMVSGRGSRSVDETRAPQSESSGGGFDAPLHTDRGSRAALSGTSNRSRGSHSAGGKSEGELVGIEFSDRDRTSLLDL